MKALLYSFFYAFRGIGQSLLSGRNIRIELAAAVYALLLSLAALENSTQWAVILLCVGTTLAAEIGNTALERLCDKVEPRRCESIRFVKDAAAGAVLVCALMAAVIGCILLLGGGGLERIGIYCRRHPWYPLLLTALLPAALIFICRRPKA